jgi:hypothetical protein
VLARRLGDPGAEANERLLNTRVDEARLPGFFALAKETLMRSVALFTVWLGWSMAMVGDSAGGNEGKAEMLFNGKDLTGWRLLNPAEAQRSKWQVVGGVRLKRGMPGLFEPKRGTGILLNGGDGHGMNLLTTGSSGDCRVHVEFNVSKGSNSGVYLMGHYEVQILDSYGKKDKELKYGDCGGIYDTAPPRTNASKAPGEWQTFDITFRAPRFNASGKKVANARFVRVVHNGKVIHENVEVKRPTTSNMGGPEKPRGPIMLQGDHGPVAFRNLKVRPLRGK